MGLEERMPGREHPEETTPKEESIPQEETTTSIRPYHKHGRGLLEPRP